MSATADSLRLAMRRFGTTVSVLTVRVDGFDHGIVATSVTSLCLTPPCVLVAINRSASIHGPLLKAKHFCIQLLKSDDHAIARDFGDKARTQYRFHHGDWSRTEHAVYLNGAQAVLFCELAEHFAYGTHVVCLGSVTDVLVDVAVDPLLYLNGAYVRRPAAVLDWNS